MRFDLITKLLNLPLFSAGRIGIVKPRVHVMNKILLFPLIIISIIAGVVVACHRSVAQTPPAPVADFTAIERMEKLVDELDANGQTNTIAKVSDLVSAMQMAETTHDASITVALLEQLRLGHTNEVISMLEKQLDIDLVGFTTQTNEIHEAELNVIKRTKAYRTRYPHKPESPYTQATLSQAFDLLDKK